MAIYDPTALLPPARREEAAPANPAAPTGPDPTTVGKYPVKAVIPKAKPDILTDAGKSALSGTAEGVVGIPGLPGTFGQMSDAMRQGQADLLKKYAPGVAEKLPLPLSDPKVYSDAMDVIQKSGAVSPKDAMLGPGHALATMLLGGTPKLGNVDETTGNFNYIGGIPFPTSQYFQGIAHDMGMPEYEPQHLIGRGLKAGGEGLPLAIATSPGGLLMRAMTGFGQGLGAEGAVEFLKQQGIEGYDTLARIVGGMAGGLVPYGIGGFQHFTSPKSVTARAEDIAGQVRREAHPDPQNVANTLRTGAANVDNGQFLPGVLPSTAQLAGAGAGREKALENQVLNIARSKSDSSAVDFDNQMAKNVETQGTAADRLAREHRGTIGDTDMEAAANVPPGGQPTASAGAMQPIKRLYERLQDAETAAWEALEPMGVEVGRAEAASKLQGFLSGLTDTRLDAFPEFFKRRVSELASKPGSTVSLQELQDMRSFALAQARNSNFAQTPVSAVDLRKFAEEIRGIISDRNNLVVASSGGTVQQQAAAEARAIQAWDDARTASRTLHDNFGDKLFAGKAVDLEPTEFIGKMLTGAEAVPNLRQIRSMPGVNVDQEVSDWVVGQLTNKGFNVTPDQINRFLGANGGRLGVIADEVPGLRSRLTDLTRRAGESIEQQQARLANAALEKATNRSPQALADYLDNNANTLKQALPVDQHEFIDQLHRTSRIMSQTGSEKLTGQQTLNLLKDGDVLSILYGKASGQIADTLGGGLMGGVAGAAFGFPTGPIGVVLGGMFGKTLAPGIVSKVQEAIVGTTQEQALAALQRAARDPAFAAVLMGRGTPQQAAGLPGILANTAVGLRNYGVKTGIMQTPAIVQDDRNRAYGGRAAYRSGGRILDHGSKADALVRAAESARKAISGTTEPLLDMPDEHVVKALAVAGEAI